MKTVASREAVYAALLAQVATAQGVKTVTRRLKHWQDVPAEEQPAVYIEHTGEVRQQTRGQPARVVLECNLWVYVATAEQEVGPVLNPVLDAIDVVLDPVEAEGNVNTLGGVVHHCWIEGQTQIFEGDLGAEAVATIPVKILVT